MSKINSGQAPSTLIPEYIGSAFDAVFTCADNINDIKPVSENINDVVTVADNILNVNKVITNVDDVALVADNIDYVKDVAEGLEGLPVSGYIGDTPPTQPKVGATWYCTLDGRNYTWYEDVDSGQWVESSPQSTADDPHLAGNIFALWKRSAAEAGYNLVAGSFEEGGVLTSSTDVLWHKGLNSIYSWAGAFPNVIAPGTDPATTSGYTVRSDVSLRNDVVLSADLAEAGSTVLISGVEAGVVAGAADALKNSLAAPSSTVSIAGLEAGKVKDAANKVRAVTIIQGAGTHNVTAAQIGSSLLFASASAVRMPTIASLDGVTGHYQIMTMDSPVTLTRIDGGKFYIRGSNVSSITIPAWSDCYVAYSAGSGVYVYGLATYETIVKSYCLVNATRTGTGAPNELVSAELPANITSNTRYVLHNPFNSNVPVICWAEVLYNNSWANPGYDGNTGSGSISSGTVAHYVQGVGIVIQTGTQGVMAQSVLLGGGHGTPAISNVASATCRVFIRKLED